jgi:hypothetical protein
MERLYAVVQPAKNVIVYVPGPGTEVGETPLAGDWQLLKEFVLDQPNVYGVAPLQAEGIFKI